MIPRPFLACLKACFCALLLAALLPSLVQAASLNPTRQSILGISRAYGFVLGQTIALDLLETAHPGLAGQARSAREAFKVAFPDAEARLEAELASVFGAKRFGEMRAETIDLMGDVLSKQEVSEVQARDFIDKVRRRAHGEGFEPDVLEYLLAAVYAADPSAEFIAGFRQRFRTDGSGKAQGLRLRLQLPRSWAGAEAERPHIVQKWISEAGSGNATILLDVRDSQDFAPTRAEIEAFVSNGGVRELAVEGGVVVDASTFTLESLPGLSVVMHAPMERLGVRMASWMQMYRIYFRGKTLSLMCMNLGAEEDAVRVEQGFRRLQPLCRQVANSLVLEQLYE